MNVFDALSAAVEPGPLPPLPPLPLPPPPPPPPPPRPRRDEDCCEVVEERVEERVEEKGAKAALKDDDDDDDDADDDVAFSNCSGASAVGRVLFSISITATVLPSSPTIGTQSIDFKRPDKPRGCQG